MVVFLDEAGKESAAFASEVEMAMSTQQVVLTSCRATVKMDIDLEYLSQHVILCPDELVDASRMFSTLRMCSCLTFIVLELDAYSTAQMPFRDFMARREEDSLCLHDQPLRRRDMPEFLERVFCVGSYTFIDHPFQASRSWIQVWVGYLYPGTRWSSGSPAYRRAVTFFSPDVSRDLSQTALLEGDGAWVFRCDSCPQWDALATHFRSS